MKTKTLILAALTALALAVAMASGWGQDHPDGEALANVQHADAAPQPDAVRV